MDYNEYETPREKWSRNHNPNAVTLRDEDSPRQSVWHGREYSGAPVIHIPVERDGVKP